MFTEIITGKLISRQTTQKPAMMILLIQMPFDNISFVGNVRGFRFEK